MRDKQRLSGCAIVALVVASTSSVYAQALFPPTDDPITFSAASSPDTIVVDGLLNESVWLDAEVIDGFIQKDPQQGQPSTLKTQVRIVYNENALYISAICEQPSDTLRIQNLQRDFSFDENDHFGVAIDGFVDRRNSVAFQVTPRGNQRDLEIIDSSDFNIDWNARWDVQTKIFDDHWVVEMAIPWQTLRYPRGADRLGIIFSRNIRYLNEKTTFPAVPRALTIYRMAYQAQISDLQPPAPSANVQVTPYILGDTSSGPNSDSDFDIGGEVKWAITPSTVLDATVNTDFAQVEVDRQVVNLERFSVFFPERRQFFLENANLFDSSVTNWIRPFFSRRIGLDSFGRPIAIDGGVRLTSRSADQQIGLLAMSQQDTETSPTTVFGVARYSRNLAGQSRLGGMVTARRDGKTGDGIASARDNFTYTIDGLWRPNQEYGIQAMVSASHDDVEGNGLGAQFWAFYENNWLYAGWLEYFNRDYNPGIGLEILDANYVMHSPAISFDLRSERFHKSIRSFNPGATAYIFNSSENGELLFGYAPIRPFRLFFQNGAQIGFVIEPNWQRLRTAFFPAGIEIAPGAYNYTRYRANWASDQSAALSVDVSYETGDYFDGKLDTTTAELRYAPIPEVELAANVSLNEIRGLGSARVDNDTEVLGLSFRLAPSPQLQFNALYQKNSVGDRESWNANLSWEYRSLSYLYLVYNRNDGTVQSLGRDASAEQLTLKLTYLFET